jgi:hypothetical protein
VLQANTDAIFYPVGLETRIEAENGNRAAGARAQTFEDFECRSLPRPVRTEQTVHFALVDLQIDTAHRLDIAVGFVKVAD